jgi:putative hydrolase of HD superfamily
VNGGTGDSSAGRDDRLAVLADCLALKDERRTGWQLRGVDDPESVAAHSWGVALLCLAFADDAGVDVDADRALGLAVVHDLAEAWTGDFPTRVDAADEPISPEEKARRERAVMADVGAQLPEVEALWEAYEKRDDGDDETARFVKDMDLIDMCLQALVYERDGRYDEGTFESDYDALDEFFATAEPRLSTDIGVDLFEQVRTRYERVRDGTDESPRRDATAGDGSTES